MPKTPIPTWCFSLVVVRRDDRFLVVLEAKHGQHWYLPAGRVEPGETFAAAAVRETLEEAGVPVSVHGIYRVEHTPAVDGTARMRVIFAAQPADETPPKSEPDEESLEARYVTLDELRALPLRGPEVLRLFEEVAAGAPAYPLSILALESVSSVADAAITE